MGKTYKDGVWIIQRDDKTPDSERQTERDDPLRQPLKAIFDGKESRVDFDAISATNNSNPEDVFIDLHENYGYICIGTGENPALNETLSPEEKLQRQQAIKQQLEAEKIPHILIRGKYMGVEENSYFIPFNNNDIGLPTILRGDIVKKIEKIAQQNNQDSLLICQKGYACYLYTSGPQKGNVITGKTAVVYPGEKQLPDDCYSLFLNADNVGTVGFTCGLNFNQVYASIEEYAAEENKTLQQHYNDFVIKPLDANANHAERKKLVVLLRGTNGYNDYAVKLKKELKDLGLNTAIFGTDANIAKINEEVSRFLAANPEDIFSNPELADLLWIAKYFEENHINIYSNSERERANLIWPMIRNEFIKRNMQIYRSLLNANDIDVIIYADMNKAVPLIMEPYLTEATNQNHLVMSHVVNSFVFEPRRSDYVEKLCHQYGSFMARHVADFKSEQGQINTNTLQFGNIKVNQFHSLPEAELAQKISVNLKSSKQDKASTSALVTGLSGAFYTQKEATPQNSSETNQNQFANTPATGM